MLFQKACYHQNVSNSFKEWLFVFSFLTFLNKIESFIKNTNKNKIFKIL